MCRLLGVLAEEPVDIEYSLLQAPNPFSSFGDHRNSDGWGMGWYQDGRSLIFKEACSALSSRHLANLAAATTSRIFACHLRKGTCGGAEEVNCHPFSHGRWLFAHNGSVDRPALLSGLQAEHRAALIGKTDSEVFFHWILQHIEREGDTLAGMKRALFPLTGYTGLNFILSDGHSLYACRHASHSLGHYSLFFLRGHLSYGRPAIIISSERLSDEDWQEVPAGHLIAVKGDLHQSLHRIHVPDPGCPPEAALESLPGGRLADRQS